ncbi:hypothetical protein [Neorhizobium galegae]|uniref:hypothetical protein n=1 Tax=Neorhizobium galegae TaxID=399 RepID=UPI000621C337|nr:hypothetical protein [Neorhizobium galegae]CDZ60680.1 Hypothetical protein NGAL_HAMBI2566_41030 [Neorhizobium galegae bv. orientalis]KAB1121707.1 hypothetical protein F4V90_24145 [Neorhizobium galegae]MCQ1574708.1 hypothetical protein [Neorhizobium galegae]MCQ1807958.1 hypothetical protein [Neorhizobium galegae]CDZ64902.1 Hypothetical protein NGAL_HAMBI2605_32270 [Neorhizobium galegae bv. orientalis]
MNDAYLSRFWGSRYRFLANAADAGRSLSPLWANIANINQPKRLEAFTAFVDEVFVRIRRLAMFCMSGRLTLIL